MSMIRVFLVFFVSVACLCLPPSSPGAAEEERVLYEGDSVYHHIRVSEVEGYRYLSFNRTRGSQSAVSVRDPFELRFPYTRASFVVPAFFTRKPGRILFVGLGGGSIPRVMGKHYPDSRIDIVEIDPDVTEVAKKFFFFEPTPKMKVIVMDGRRFLRSSREEYDLIFLDAYDDRSIPFHLTTKEFFETVKKRLAPGGIVASNVWGPRADEFYLSEVKTYQQVFPHVYLIDAVLSNNYILIAESRETAMTKTMLEGRMPSLQERFRFDFDLKTYADTFEDLSALPIDAKVLRDDFAPVEHLRSRKAASK